MLFYPRESHDYSASGPIHVKNKFFSIVAPASWRMVQLSRFALLRYLTVSLVLSVLGKFLFITAQKIFFLKVLFLVAYVIFFLSVTTITLERLNQS